jgi:hypothetical protein
MREFDKIYLSWRKAPGHKRHIVGVLQNKTEESSYVFQYFPEAAEEAMKEGFTAYTEFRDIHASYNGNTLDIFAQRLTKSQRPDVQKFYDFWEIDSRHTADKFYLLGHTQGLLPTDNFEFLADYNPIDGLHFLTELAGLTYTAPPGDSLIVGDTLEYRLQPTNEHDPEAVMVFKGEMHLGFIKKIHCRVFHKPGAEALKLTVKAIDKNGIIRRVFVKVHK